MAEIVEQIPASVTISFTVDELAQLRYYLIRQASETNNWTWVNKMPTTDAVDKIVYDWQEKENSRVV